MSTTMCFSPLLKGFLNTLLSPSKLSYSLFTIQTKYPVLCEVFLTTWTEMRATHSVLSETLVHSSNVAVGAACVL